MDKLNKYQEALDSLFDNIQVTQQNMDGLDFCGDVLQELIDKETPMKPNLFLCPNCNSDYICEETIRGRNRYFDRCECGQLIDWSDEE